MGDKWEETTFLSDKNDVRNESDEKAALHG